MEIENILLLIGIIALFLLEGLLEVALLSLIGAFVRRIFGNKKKKFNEYYKENKVTNSIIGLIALIVIVGILFGVMILIRN